MKLLPVIALALTLPTLAAAQSPDQEGMYQPQKLVKDKAENFCELLANINLRPQDFQSITLHTEPKTYGIAESDRDGYHILVTYPYRTDGVNWACVFRDYRQGALLQLVEFGLIGGEQEEMRIIEPLW
ncbi:hypothetical protein LWH94_01800 [Marinobacter sp. G11]|uniref:hypothetical protein n=1 Tax=Marinobacter sp. G11 TaxID=2903522 RepID=UPI001E54DC57|nr:hypothetical protein [Marinobacter sp. G11]MCE0757929.1 hypothetical protein [Marinobacter sp. G11]